MTILFVILAPNIITVSDYYAHPGFNHFSLAQNYSSKSLNDTSYYELAEYEFEAVLELMPLYPPVYLEFGKFYYQHGEIEKATEKFEFYVGLAPEEKGEQFYKANPEFYEVFDYLPPQNL